MEKHEEENAPLFKSWKQWYVFVVAFLFLLMILFFFFTKQFS